MTTPSPGSAARPTDSESFPSGGGDTRTHVARNHAVVGPDSHVVAPVPGWTDTDGVVLIAPGLGPGVNTSGGGPEFVQYLAHLETASTGGPAPQDCQRFVYVLEGEATIGKKKLKTDGYAWFPPNHEHIIHGKAGTRLWVHEQFMRPKAGDRSSIASDDEANPPEAFFGHIDDVTAEPFMGDPDARLAKLLPQDTAFDLEVNRFTFDPGAALPLVETHVNEHGLYMLEGAGVYRLGSGNETHWQTVQQGDAIWMGPFCPQWFACFGKTQATYLYSKNVNRHPLG